MASGESFDAAEIDESAGVADLSHGLDLLDYEASTVQSHFDGLPLLEWELAVFY